MRKHLLTLTAAVLLVSFTACETETKKEETTEVAHEANEAKHEDSNMEDDAQWAVKAASSGMAEVALAQLAQKNGSSAKLKELARMMEQDHTKANDELKELAGKKNITLPTAMGEDHQEDYDELAKKTGADFDKAYAEAMVEDHDDAIAHFKKGADNAKDADVKNWAAGKVSKLEHHLEMAKSTRDAVK